MATAPIIVAGAGTTEVVAAVANARIRVYRYTIVCAAAQTVTWKSGSTAITGDMAFGANGGENPLAFKDCVFETAIGEALNVTTTGAAGGHLEYEYSYI